MTRRYIHHTADLCFQVRARTLSLLFREAGEEVLRLLQCAPGSKNGEGRLAVFLQESSSLDELFHDWLDEVLKGVCLRSWRPTRLRLSVGRREGPRYRLKATLYGRRAPWGGKEEQSMGGPRPLGADLRAPHREIKAVTYHQLKVVKKKKHWLAQVVLDV